jgi:hypothetical protein
MAAAEARSALPTQFANITYARWNEQVSSGVTAGKTAVGINHANETNENNKTLIAGVLSVWPGSVLVGYPGSVPYH